MKITLTVQIEKHIHEALKRNCVKIEKQLKVAVPLAQYARNIIENEVKKETVLKRLKRK